MADVAFYHLLRSGPEQALPQLLGRTLKAGQRALVRCGSADRVAALDTALWLATEPDWLPHGTPASGNPDLQPIWIDTDDRPINAARYLFLIDGAEATDLAQWDRVFDLFDGNDEAAVAAARTRWKTAKTAGHSLAYWQQTPRGWEKKA